MLTSLQSIASNFFKIMTQFSSLYRLEESLLFPFQNVDLTTQLLRGFMQGTLKKHVTDDFIPHLQISALRESTDLKRFSYLQNVL